ncbi:efflux transporter outer membrane subunit [Comamonas endophytica]|uniref:Efflux transporter outer membrane subunit n=1 Tax=Comamonas endophytica TaxID=2949090 RepID=A0ABY6GDN5_9BURK|nr:MULTISPECIES: efflux transporter outer membrane subunit [unclassified Acidovorax]MCD2512654.1 efflux transporter outer membrane subunit [Acidovorax sp. D4N7]UYG52988.1 efflux transporter outer membrane subunit [Acidovorax sp. 5MLIR]
MINRCTPVALAAALLMAGCSFIPTYERPAAPVPEAYRSAPQGAAGTQPAAALPWQQFFTDARLQQLIGLALNNNRDLQVAVLNIEQARSQYRITRADQFPTIGGGINASRAPDVVNGGYANSFQVGLQTTAWEIDFFGRIGALKEQALAQYLATEEGMRATQVSLVSSVASTWYALLADEELLAISRRTLETREASVELTRLRFDAGAASELDYRQAVSLTESARATLAQQQRQRALDANALALLLGQPLPPEIDASIAGTRLDQAAALPALPAGLPSDLLIQRPDIRQAEQALIGANANIGAARANFFPRIALTAQVGTASSELSGLFNGGSWGFSLAPSALLPIFDAGRNNATLDAAVVNRRIAVAQYEKAIQTAFREVSDALDSQAALAEQDRAQRAQLEAESVRLRLSDLRYRNGVSSYLDLLDAQRTLFALEQSVVQVRLAQLQNQLLLYRALGGGVTSPTPLASAAVAR